MASVLKLMAELGLDAGGFKKELDGAQKTADSASKKIQSALGGIVSGPLIPGLIALAAGVAGVTYALVKCAQAAGEEQATILRLSAAVKASGGNWEEASTAIDRYLRAERTRTALDDGEGRESLIQLVTATGDYTKAMKLLPIAIDLARAKKMDLVTASELVGKVSVGETAMLTRYGIVLREGASATEALIELQRRFAGQGEAFAQSFQGQMQMLQITIDEVKEGLGYAILPLLTRLATGARTLLEPVQEAISALGPLIGDELVLIAQAVLPHGENLTASFAQGIAQGVPYVLAALKLIRMSIEYLLAPGSPPKLLPTLDDWGAGAAQSWLEGWTSADFGVLREMSGVIRAALGGLVAEGALTEGAVNPLMRSIRAQIAAALEELRATGAVSAGTMGGFTGPTAGYAQAYLGAQAADAEVKALEAQLATATTAQEVNTLAEQLDAARARARAAKEQYTLEQDRLQALADESDLMREQLDATRQMTQAAKDLGKEFKEAFDPARIQSFADQFIGGGGQASPWESLFDPAVISSKADELAAGWLKGLTPMLDTLRELVGGSAGAQGVPASWAAAHPDVAGGGGGLLGAVTGAIGTMGSAIGRLGDAIGIMLATGDWRTALRELGFSDEEIGKVDSMMESVDTLASALEAVAGAINAVHTAWQNFQNWWNNAKWKEGMTIQGVPIPNPGGGEEKHATGFDGVVTGPMYIPAFGMVGDQGSERLTVTPLGKGAPGSSYTQNNYFYVNSLDEQKFAQARRDDRLKAMAPGAGF